MKDIMEEITRGEVIGVLNNILESGKVYIYYIYMHMYMCYTHYVLWCMHLFIPNNSSNK